MSKKGADKKTVSKISVNVKKSFRVFAVNFYGPFLENFGKSFAAQVESGARKKILGVTYKIPPGPANADESKHPRFILEAVEKRKRQLETAWKGITMDMAIELRSYWEGYSDVSMRDSRLDRPLEPINEHLHEPPHAHETTPRRHTGSFRSSFQDRLSLYSPRAPPPPPPVSVITKMISDEDMRLMYADIEGMELDIRDYFVVIFGRISMQIAIDLLSNVPIQVIIHFIPCPESELETNFPELFNELDQFRRSQETKGVAVFIKSLTAPQEHFEARFFPQIYDQFTWYLYDIEMIAQQFCAYKNEFAEVNDAMPSHDRLFRAPFGVQSTKDASDDTAVCVYLDNLCNEIENRTDKDRRYSALHHRPFLENDYQKIIVEDANELLQSAISTRMNMVSYWRVVDVLVTTLKGYAVCTKGCEKNMKLPPHYELLSWESFAQRLESMKILYDECCRVDMTHRCKMFILRRTFNKIITRKKKYRLPTRLCMRDFCEYIAPDLPTLLRKSNEPTEPNADDDDDDESVHQGIGHRERVSKYNTSHDPVHTPARPPSVVSQPQEDGQAKDQEPPRFSGLTFDDTLQELSVTEKLYRFEHGLIRCVLEHWLYKEKKLTMEMRLCDCLVYAHRWDDYVAKFPGIRIITKNNVACNIEMLDEIDFSSISIQWPNDCQIRYVSEDGAQGVEQRYHWKRKEERKRLFTPQGCVLNYLKDDVIDVLTPNGVLFKLYPSNYTDVDRLNELKYYRPPPAANVAHEWNFVRSLQAYGIDCEHFDVTQSNGKKLRILSGSVVEEKDHYLIYEWMDLTSNEIYAERDDGIKMIWSSECLRCYYPCGTMIMTTVTDDVIEMTFECRSKSTESILRKMNPILVERIVSKAAKRDLYVTYNMNYFIQHKNYASVGFYGDDKMVIYSPDNVKLVLSDQNLVVLDIGDALSFRITSGSCTILSAGQEDKHFLVRLNLLPTADEVLYFQSNYATVTVKANGDMIHTDENDGIPPYQEELYFLAKKYKFGMAFLSEKEFQEITTNFPTKTYVYTTPDKVVLFKPILPINVRYSMPMPEMEKRLENFKSYCQRQVPKEPEEVMERVLAARTIYTLKTVPADICSLIQDVYFIEATLGKNVEDALEYFLARKTKPKFSLKWKQKIKAVQENFRYQTQRMYVYNAMLRQNVYPKFHKYENCKGNLKTLNIDDVLPRLEGFHYKAK